MSRHDPTFRIPAGTTLSSESTNYCIETQEAVYVGNDHASCAAMMRADNDRSPILQAGRASRDLIYYLGDLLFGSPR